MPPFRLRFAVQNTGQASTADQAPHGKSAANPAVPRGVVVQEAGGAELGRDGPYPRAQSTPQGPTGQAPRPVRKAWVPNAFPDAVSYRSLFSLAMQVSLPKRFPVR